MEACTSQTTLEFGKEGGEEKEPKTPAAACEAQILSGRPSKSKVLQWKPTAALAAPEACFLTLQVGLGVLLLFCRVVWDLVLAHYRIAQERVGDRTRHSNGKQPITSGLTDLRCGFVYGGHRRREDLRRLSLKRSRQLLQQGGTRTRTRRRDTSLNSSISN